MTGRETLAFVASLSPDASTPDRGVDRPASSRTRRPDATPPTAGPETYSGGMRQRLGIAQALVTRPRVLLLDEPVSALDPIGRREVLDLMSALKGETTVFYSTHILDDVERVSDHVAILDHGRLVRAAATAELLASLHASTGSVSSLGGADDSTGVDLATLPGVQSVEPAARDGDLRTYLLRIRPRTRLAVQRDVTRFAADRDLTLIENSLVRLGAGGRVPPPHRHQGACGMTAQTITGAVAASAPRRSPVRRPRRPRPQGHDRVDPRQAGLGRPGGHGRVHGC